ncbi:MAG: hypothetical protein KIT09_18450 [Bryobacteraceae bacterium]|nr:hypothetical protein [Bryobacteraceae bacterium]
MSKTYINQAVGRPEREDLAKIAATEEGAFFARNRRLAQPYRDRLLAIALCQGAALQYLGGGHGVNDFDDWQIQPLPGVGGGEVRVAARRQDLITLSTKLTG